MKHESSVLLQQIVKCDSGMWICIFKVTLSFKWSIKHVTL